MPAIFAAAALITLWLTGLLFVKGGFNNNTYQLLINTVTTVITFLMVFVIQNVQNREGEATQTKIDAIMQALIDVSVALKIDLTQSPLAELVGVEDEDEDKILTAQAKVRSPGTPAQVAKRAPRTTKSK